MPLRCFVFKFRRGNPNGSARLRVVTDASDEMFASLGLDPITSTGAIALQVPNDETVNVGEMARAWNLLLAQQELPFVITQIEERAPVSAADEILNLAQLEASVAVMRQLAREVPKTIGPRQTTKPKPTRKPK